MWHSLSALSQSPKPMQGATQSPSKHTNSNGNSNALRHDVPRGSMSYEHTPRLHVPSSS